MALVMNASSIEHTIKIHGAYFTFKPSQIKDMSPEKVSYLTSNGAYLGFVELPEEMGDLDHKQSKEGKAKLEEARREGIARRVSYLESLYRNENTSLRQDKARKNDTSDPRLDMSSQMLKNLEELAGYKTELNKAQTEHLKKVQDLEAMLEQK